MKEVLASPQGCLQGFFRHLQRGTDEGKAGHMLCCRNWRETNGPELVEPEEEA